MWYSLGIGQRCINRGRYFFLKFKECTNWCTLNTKHSTQECLLLEVVLELHHQKDSRLTLKRQQPSFKHPSCSVGSCTAQWVCTVTENTACNPHPPPPQSFFHSSTAPNSLHSSGIFVAMMIWCLWQRIQTVSAVDADEPSSGHKFFFSLAPDGTYRSNFTVRDNGGRQDLTRLCLTWNISIQGDRR